MRAISLRRSFDSDTGRKAYVASQVWGYKTGCPKLAPGESLGHVWMVGQQVRT